jgi:ketosteroid isomerase-like protein
MADLDLSPREKCIRDMFAAVDRKDARGLTSFMTEDGIFLFGNMPAAIGHDVIASAAQGFFDGIGSLRHDFVAFYDQGDTWIIEQVVHYVDQWGRAHSLPCVNVLRFRDELIADYRVYMNNSPLFIAPADPALA